MKNPGTPSVQAVVGATFAALMIAAMSVLVLPVLAPELSGVLGVDASLIGYQISAVYAGAMTSAAAGGYVVERLGACRATQLAVVLAAVGLLLVTTSSLAAMLVASVLLGFGYGSTNPAAAHLLTIYTPASRRNFIFSLKQTGVPLGGMAVAIMAPAVTHRFGWQAALMLIVVLAAALAVLLQRVRANWDQATDPGPIPPDPHRPSARPSGMLGSVRFVWKRPNLRYLSLMAMCFASVQLCLMTFAVTFLVADVHYTLVQAGILLSVIQFVGAIGRIGWGWIADRLHASRITLLTLGAFMLASALAVTQVTEHWSAPLTWGVFIAMGITAIGWNGVFLAEVARLAPHGESSTATGGALFFTFTGVLIGPSLFTWIYSHVGSYATTFGFAAVLAASGVICLVRAK